MIFVGLLKFSKHLKSISDWKSRSNHSYCWLFCLTSLPSLYLYTSWPFI